MRKLFTLLAVMAGAALSSNAQTTVGAEDNTAAFFTEFSDYYEVPANKKATFHFTNYSNCASNWNNFVTVVTNNVERGGAGYLEYAVIRADRYGWGNNFNAGTWETEAPNWDEFRPNMDGAEVTAVVNHSGANIRVSYEATAKNGNVYKQSFVTYDCGEPDDVINVFFTVEASHIVFPAEGAFTLSEADVIEKPEPVVYPEAPFEVDQVVGAKDCTSAWWSQFSECYTVEPETSTSWTIFNTTLGEDNYQNWCIAGTNLDRTAEGYGGANEYFVLRSDLYGWGNGYNDGTWTNEGYPTNDDEWAEFRKQMNGAIVTVTVAREGDVVTMTGKSEGNNGKTYIETFTMPNVCKATDPLIIFFIADHSCLQFKKDGISGVESAIADDVNAPVEYYNLQGVRVAEPAQGLYIIKQGNKVSKRVFNN